MKVMVNAPPNSKNAWKKANGKVITVGERTLSENRDVYVYRLKNILSNRSIAASLNNSRWNALGLLDQGKLGIPCEICKPIVEIDNQSMTNFLRGREQ